MTTPYQQAKQQFANSKVLIFGLGLLGGAVGDTRFFSQIGAKVTVTDSKTDAELKDSLDQLKDYPVTFHLGGHSLEDIANADYIIRNPSVPLDHPLLNQARQLNKPILMRSSLFASLFTGKIIGVTGTRGKTTTTTMIYQILSNLLPQPVFLGGNIQGYSDLELLAKITYPAQTMVVLELSSWQLQGFAANHQSPSISLITNLYPDHLNRYASLSHYYADKRAIMSHQSPEDVVCLNQQQSEFHLWAKQAPGQVKWFSSANLPQNLALKIDGPHNLENAAAAIAVAETLGIKPESSAQILNQFTGVKYRFETIAILNNVTYINDTTSTTPTATKAALASVKHPPILILGGADKQLPLDDLATLINQQVKKVVFLSGSGTDLLAPKLDPNLILGTVDSMNDAVNLATQSAKAQDIILLSPGFASFGLFVNEFDRGDQFNQCVQNLN